MSEYQSQREPGSDSDVARLAELHWGTLKMQYMAQAGVGDLRVTK